MLRKHLAHSKCYTSVAVITFSFGQSKEPILENKFQFFICLFIYFSEDNRGGELFITQIDCQSFSIFR